MEDKEARDILLALLNKGVCAEVEREAIRTAIGVLSWTAIAKDRMRKKIAAQKSNRKHYNV